jgi:hypothetical protein
MPKVTAEEVGHGAQTKQAVIPLPETHDHERRNSCGSSSECGRLPCHNHKARSTHLMVATAPTFLNPGAESGFP